MHPVGGLLARSLTVDRDREDLFSFLSTRLKGFTLLGIDNTGVTVLGSPSDLFPNERIEQFMAAATRAKATDTPLHTNEPGYFLLPVPRLDVTLLLHTAQPERQETIVTLISLAAELFFASKELRNITKKLNIQKTQFNRKFTVRNSKYQEMLEETQRSYQIIQEQQENDSKTLKSEIQAQTRELRKSKADAGDGRPRGNPRDP